MPLRRAIDRRIAQIGNADEGDGGQNAGEGDQRRPQDGPTGTPRRLRLIGGHPLEQAADRG